MHSHWRALVSLTDNPLARWTSAFNWNFEACCYLLTCWIILKFVKDIFILWIVSWIWLDPNRWYKPRSNNACCLSYSADTMPADALMLLSRNIPFSAAEELIDGQPWLPRTEMDHPTINHGWSTGRPRIFSAALLVHHIPTYLSQH